MNIKRILYRLFKVEAVEQVMYYKAREMLLSQQLEEQKEARHTCESKCAGQVMRLIGEASKQLMESDDVKVNIRVAKNKETGEFVLRHFSVSLGSRAVEEIINALCRMQHTSTSFESMSTILRRFSTQKKRIMFIDENCRKRSISDGHCGRCEKGQK